MMPRKSLPLSYLHIFGSPNQVSCLILHMLDFCAFLRTLGWNKAAGIQDVPDCLADSSTVVEAQKRVVWHV